MRRRAQDRAAQSNLRNGLTAAKAFFTDNETFVGFDLDMVADNPDTDADEGAADIEPSLTWNNGATVQGQVSIDDLGVSTVVLTTLSASGDVFCIGDNAGQNVFGNVDADTAVACVGGW